MLRSDLTEDAYWRDVHGSDVSEWQDALESVRARHALPSGAVKRFALGRNVVFALGGDFVVKFVPPFWCADLPREVLALELAFGQLPVETPRLAAHGHLDHWGYLVMTRLPGRPLRDVWSASGLPERARWSLQHGEILLALHGVRLPAGSPLAFDWLTFHELRRQTAPEALRRSGVREELLRDFPDFSRAAWPALAAPTRDVFLHGDLNFLNLLVTDVGGNETITGLIDFSDTSLGANHHEFISPGVHMYRGDESALRSFYAGADLTMTGDLAMELTFRSALYYADEFQRMLSAVPGAVDARTWRDVAARFWPSSRRATIAT